MDYEWEPELLAEVKSYFHPQKWEKMSAFEKNRNYCMLENHRTLLRLGLEIKSRPYFMEKGNRDFLADSSSSSDEDDIDVYEKQKIIMKSRKVTKNKRIPKRRAVSVGNNKKEGNDKNVAQDKSLQSNVEKGESLPLNKEAKEMLNHPSTEQHYPLLLEDWVQVCQLLSETNLNDFDDENEFFGFANSENYQQIAEKLQALNNYTRCREKENKNDTPDLKVSDNSTPVVKTYPKRDIPRVNYTELAVPEDDDFIFCDDCNYEWEGSCQVHGPLHHIQDTEVTAELVEKNVNTDVSTLSVPANMVVAESRIPYAGQGVWTGITIPRRSVFGPYKGKIESLANQSGYCWQICHDRRPSHCIDAHDVKNGNWMRYVNCARHQDEQNVIAYQFKGKIYYHTFSDILPHSEILVYYGDQYAKQLGIDTQMFKSKIKEPLKSLVFPCTHCGLMYSSPLYQAKHEELCKNNKHSESDRKYMCEECGKKFKTKQKLNQHAVTHTGERLFICELCNKRFTPKGSLNTHVNTVHNREKKFQCDVCSKKFSLFGILNRHKRTHSKEMPFSCDVCNKTFFHSSNLTEHMRVHTGERPYSCNICTETFINSSNLKRHMRVHTGERPYSCTFCDMKFTQSSHIKKHIKTKHGQH